MSKKEFATCAVLFFLGVAGMLWFAVNEFGYLISLSSYIPFAIYVLSNVNWEATKRVNDEFNRQQALEDSGRSYTRDWPPGGVRRWTRNQLNLNKWRW